VIVTRGDVVTVAAQGDKPRPAVIIQSNRVGTMTVLIAPVTSELTGAAPIRIRLDPSAANGLRLRSEIMVDKIFPIARSKIGTRVGRLDGGAIRQLEAALLFVLGFAD
jgi:mRNA interferase MazF